ncbi:MAG: DUF4293 domain-containing protein [Flavobacteriaceae bacterium]|nr:DUF4293 domain-containing protein [Flavobacteriaceae bacterium]
MIQRIQSLYLFIVALIAGFLPFYFPVWKIGESESLQAVFAKDLSWVSYVFYAVALLALAALFMFKNRQNQFVMNRLNMILNLILLGFFVYRSLSLSGETISEKGIGMLIPAISIVFLVFANKAIRKDENLVKSVDRLR